MGGVGERKRGCHQLVTTMAELIHDCPHCRASRTAFTCHGSQFFFDEEDAICHWNTLFVCRHCHGGMVVRFFAVDEDSDPGDCIGDPRSDGFRINAVHPSPARLEAPAHVSSVVARNFVEGLENLHSKRFTSAAMMFRRVLEMATRTLDPENKDATLRRRIADLKERGKITAELGTWLIVFVWMGMKRIMRRNSTRPRRLNCTSLHACSSFTRSHYPNLLNWQRVRKSPTLEPGRRLYTADTPGAAIRLRLRGQ